MSNDESKKDKPCEICGSVEGFVDLVTDPIHPKKLIRICDACYGERLEELNKKDKK